ncbi:unnamed protein product [Ceutorhynchus assimilis]|uniref:Origin recognition complex subunit 1 n=1 Tax=Ceutorhynchus assimilis TaxID=467358 RepID=A0A9N9QPG5_9CUCU|nr:unnamed protein product [Ceutorhynchus assimilis]
MIIENIDSPNDSILSYSIVSSDEEENPLVLKLKISQSTRIPVVRLQKLDFNQYAVSPRTSTRPRKMRSFEDYEVNILSDTHPKAKSTPKKRSSNEETEIMDVEMNSPKIQRPRGTPKKTYYVDSDSDENLYSLCELTNKINLKTPTKRFLSKNEDTLDNEGSPAKKGTLVKTPVKTTPSRKASKRVDLNLSPMDENQGKRRIQTPQRYSDYSLQKSARKNLNESFRRTILKSRHNEENIKKDSDDSSRRRTLGRARTSYKQFYDSEDDDAEAFEVALKNSKMEISKPTTKRVLRSRSSSIASNYSPSCSFSSMDTDNDSIPGNKRLTKSRTNSEVFVHLSPEKVSKKEILTPKTPKTPRTRRLTTTTPKTAPKTPKNPLKLLRDGVITPSMHSRSKIIPRDSTPLMRARSQLHVSYVPTSLPCREKEYLDIYNFLRGKLDDSCGGCMYISGVPGTGKTATVTSVIESLLSDKKVSKFSYVNINGMRLTEPRQSYVEIWKQLTGKMVPWVQAQSLLEERFTKKKNQSTVVMLIDELDILCTKRQDVVYNLLDWPTKSKDQLIVITIANTMDLPERLLMSRVTSRLGLTRLTFQAYTHKQLMEIVTKRLSGIDSFNSDAVQLVARKVASVSGDARRALDICRRAAELAEEEGKDQTVNIMHINEALNAMITQPQVMAMRKCSRLQKLLLQAVVAEIERTGVEETTFAEVFKMLVSCCALDGFKMVSSTIAQRALSQLSACKLILTDQKCSDIYQRIILNVSVHDVYFALKKE